MVLIVEAIVCLLILSGLFFFFTTALGVLRFGDLYSRLHASSKGSTLGLALTVLGSILYFSLHGLLDIKQLLILGFIFLTSPISAHILSRAAYRKNVPTWERMRTDEWRDLIR